MNFTPAVDIFSQINPIDFFQIQNSAGIVGYRALPPICTIHSSFLVHSFYSTKPGILEFTTFQTQLKASTNEFLIIEILNLGYRIKFLLEEFTFDNKTNVTSYDGVSIFEELQGSSK